MKQTAAILFVLVVAFNIYGYRWVISCMQNSSSVTLEEKVEKKEYNDNELISVKVLLSLPYYTSSKEYERSYGSITINGIDYEYVKRRALNDTLELLCLPNFAKTKLQVVSDELLKSSVNVQSPSSHKKTGNVIKVSFPDFFQEVHSPFSYAVRIPTQSYHCLDPQLLLPGYFTKQERPPEAV